MRDRPWERNDHGPHPLIDVASIMLLADVDPLARFARSESELEHHPLGDARQSARLLVQCLDALEYRQTLPKFPLPGTTVHGTFNLYGQRLGSRLHPAKPSKNAGTHGGVLVATVVGDEGEVWGVWADYKGRGVWVATDDGRELVGPDNGGRIDWRNPVAISLLVWTATRT